MFELFKKQQREIVANDGCRYTKQQYVMAQPLVRLYLEDRGWTVESIGILEVVGSLSVIAKKEGHGTRGFSFYMRDLVAGVIREDGQADYFNAVRMAGVVER